MIKPIELTPDEGTGLRFVRFSLNSNPTNSARYFVRFSHKHAAEWFAMFTAGEVQLRTARADLFWGVEFDPACFGTREMSSFAVKQAIRALGGMAGMIDEGIHFGKI